MRFKEANNLILAESLKMEQQLINKDNISTITIVMLLLVLAFAVWYLFYLEQRYNEVVIQLNQCRQAAQDELLNWTGMGEALWR